MSTAIVTTAPSMDDDCLTWDDQLVKPIGNMIMPMQLGDNGVVHVTKFGVERENGFQLGRQSLMCYGDMVVVPHVFLLSLPVVTTKLVEGEEVGFYSASKCDLLATVVSTKSDTQLSGQMALVPMTGSVKAMNLLSSEAKLQHEAASATQIFRKMWQQKIIRSEVEKSVTFTDIELFKQMQECGSRIMRLAKEKEVTGERWSLPEW